MQSRPFKTPKQVLTAVAFSIGNSLSSAFMGDTENLLVQIKVNHHQLVGDLRVEGQIHDETLLVHLAIHQTAEPLELQKVHHLGKGQLGWVGSRKKFRRNIWAYIVPVELHKKCHNA